MMKKLQVGEAEPALDPGKFCTHQKKFEPNLVVPYDTLLGSERLALGPDLTKIFCTFLSLSSVNSPNDHSVNLKY